MKNKSEVADQSKTPRKSLGEPVSLDLEAKSSKTSQSMVLENNSINCFSKEVYDSNQKDCSNEAQNWVCGCNNISYPNDCEAKKAGVLIENNVGMLYYKEKEIHNEILPF